MERGTTDEVSQGVRSNSGTTTIFKMQEIVKTIAISSSSIASDLNHGLCEKTPF